MGNKCSITWYLLHILSKFAIMRNNDTSVAKIVNTHMTKVFMAIFTLAERLPTSAKKPQKHKPLCQSMHYALIPIAKCQ